MFRSAYFRASLLVVVAVSLLFVALIGGAAWRARQVALDSRERLSALRESVPVEVMAGGAVASTADGTAASVDAPVAEAGPATVRRTCEQVGELERDLRPVTELARLGGPAGELIGRLPRVGEQAAAMLSLGQAAGEISSSLRQACEAIEPVVQRQAGGADASARVALLVDGLGAARGDIREATARLRVAHARLAAVDKQVLDESIRPFLVDVRDRLPAATDRLALLAEVPGLLGYDGPRDFLILGQNTDELRPTGGFIGTGGVITFDRGRLLEYRYGSSYEFDLPSSMLVTPPKPLLGNMDGGYWHLREANWWPDFPSAAQQARYFYNLTRPEPLTGVVAIDQHLIAHLLRVTGPIEVPEYDEVVTAENVHDRLDYHVHVVGSGTEETRKGFVSALFPTILDRLTSLPKERVPDLTAALTRGLEEQHLQVWIDDDLAQQPIAGLGWDGGMLPTSGDYLYPVSVNVGSNKINRDVEQELAYEVSQEPTGRLVGRAVLTLRNRRSTADPGPYATADYLNFLRVYAPARSELLSAAGFQLAPEALSECGRVAFSGLVVVPPGQDRRVELTYRLPPTIDPAGYTLLVQRQPGTNGAPIQVHAFGGELWLESGGPRLLRAVDGQLSPVRWMPTPGVTTTAPVCDVHVAPPRILAAPSEVLIPRLGLRAEVVGLGVEPDGTLASPATGGVVGWYAPSARPGQIGNMVASGHLDWDKRPAVFWRLKEAHAGDRISVIDEEGGRYEYEVEWVKQVDPESAPLNEILGPTTERALTLITCGGTFNPLARDYSERTVVRARLASAV